MAIFQSLVAVSFSAPRREAQSCTCSLSLPAMLAQMSSRIESPPWDSHDRFNVTASIQYFDQGKSLASLTSSSPDRVSSATSIKLSGWFQISINVRDRSQPHSPHRQGIETWPRRLLPGLLSQQRGRSNISLKVGPDPPLLRALVPPRHVSASPSRRLREDHTLQRTKSLVRPYPNCESLDRPITSKLFCLSIETVLVSRSCTTLKGTKGSTG